MPSPGNQSSSLPPGYVLDSPSQPSAGVPAGYTLDTSSVAQPIQDNSTVGPAPGLLQRTGQEAKLIGSAAVNSKFPYLHPLDALNAAETQGAGEIERYAPQPVTEALLGGQASGKPLGTKSGLLNNPLTPMLATPELEALGAGSAAANAYKPVQDAGGISGVYNTTKGAIGDLARDTTTGKLRPLVDVASRGVGAYVGHGIGRTIDPQSPYGGYAGEVAGAIAGPTFADAVLPASPTFQGMQTANQLDKGIQDAFKARMKETANVERLRNQEATTLNSRSENDSPYSPSSNPNDTPFEPLVYSSPYEADQIDQRMANLKRQASSAGTYHAAQGAAGKKINLQQRITNAYSPVR